MLAIKNDLRRQLGDLRSALSATERARLSRTIHRRLLADARLQNCRRVGLYASMRGEVETEAFFASLRARGCACAYPRVRRRDATLEFALVAHLHELRPGAFGIAEPQGEAIDLNTLDIIFVPGVGFDRRGNRLGYGAGYYDRTLAGFGGLCVGLAYGVQVIDNIPIVGTDRPMDAVVTEQGWVSDVSSAEAAPS